MKSPSFGVLAAALWAVAAAASAQTLARGPQNDLEFFEFEKLSLQESMNIRTDVAARKPLSARESPGIVTIVTREEIERSGARNLIDILRVVPGFEFGLDLEGIVGPGFRGLWGQEGKILVLVDGQEFNDLGYAAPFIARFSAAQIERLEVIRGPGSVVYGGNAELAVISIVTRGWREKGGEVEGNYGVSSNGGDRRALDLRYGHEGAGLRLSGSAHLAQSLLSDRDYTDINGVSYPMKGNSVHKAKNLNIGVEKGGFRGRVIVDEFATVQRDAFGVSQSSRATQVNNYTYLAEASYGFTLGERWTLTPRFNLNHQRPWNERDEFFMYDKTFSRYRESLDAAFEASDALHLSAGLEFQQDRAKVSDDTAAAALWPGGNRQIGFDNRATFAQAIYDSPFGSFIGGGRYEHHSAFNDSFVPRLAWTLALDRVHVKTLYSEAFRAPSLENIRLNTGIRPERTTTYELEAGYELSRTLYATVSLFEMMIRKPIVYHSDPVTSTEFYSNDDPTGSRGVELSCRWKAAPGFIDASYSFYSATKNRVPLYAVPGHSDVLLGFPAHKVAFNASYTLGRGFSVNPSGAWLAERYGYYALDAAGNRRVRRFSNAAMLNLFLLKKGLFGRDTSVGVGVYDLFNSNYGYIQPYNSGHAPLPGSSREYALRVTHAF